MFIERCTVHSRSSLSACIAWFAAVGGALPVSGAWAADAIDDGAGLQEVVVTAQRMETSLQKTPVSVTAYDASTLQDLGARSLLDISAFTPGLQIAGSGTAGAGSYAIRGVGVNAIAASASPSVGIYVDDVYLPSGAANLLSLFDVAQVSVLRGPQGTLFGRNTIAGAVQYTTVKPSTAGVSGFLEATGGNLGRADFVGAVNVPLSSTFAVRLSLASMERDGYVHDVLNDTERGSDRIKEGRLQALWTPTDQLSVLVEGNALRQENNGPAIVVLDVNPASALAAVAYVPIPFGGGATAPPFDSTLVSNSKYELAGFNAPTHATLKYYSGQGTITYRFSDSLALTSITAYSTAINTGVTDSDFTPAPVVYVDTGHAQTNLFTEELRSTGHSFGNQLDWTAGAYYYDQHNTSQGGTFNIGVALSIPSAALDLTAKAWALYGQATYHLTDRLSGTVGVRYSSETSEGAVPELPVVSPAFPVSCGGGDWAPCGSLSLSASTTFTNTSPYAGLQFQVNPDVMIYAKAGEGFRAGGNQIVSGVAGWVPYGEETAWTYEIGSRMEFLDRRVRVNPTLFYTDWKDIQFNALDPTGIPYTRNAGDATIKGAELEMQFAPTKPWLLTASVGYVDGHYTRIDPSVAFKPLIDPVTGMIVHQVDLSLDDPMQQSPKLKYAVGARYTLPLAIEGQVSASVDYAWVDTIRSAVTDSDTIQLPSYGLLNARLQYSSPGDHWTVAVFGNNLTGEYYYVGGSNIESGPGVIYAAPGLPRQYGVTLRYSF